VGRGGGLLVSVLTLVHRVLGQHLSAAFDTLTEASTLQPAEGEEGGIHVRMCCVDEEG
jgi:hypothetical protein